MFRGKNQVLFKFLPGKPIDYNQGNAIALVKEWFSEKITDINKTRVVKEVYNSINSFKRNSSKGENATRGFPKIFDPTAFELLTPVFINAELFPLTFTCDSCGRAYSFTSVQQIGKILRKHKCGTCNGNLSQLDLIYFHECGHIWEPKPAPCKEHKFQHLILNKHGSRSPKEWRWDCGVCGKETANLNNWCPSCKTGSQVYPRPFRQTSVFTPHSSTLVNLQNIDEDRLYEDDIFKRLILAKYINLFSKYDSTFEECLKMSSQDDNKLDELIEDLRKKQMPEETIKQVLTSMNKVNPDKKDVRNKILSMVDRLVHPPNGDMTTVASKAYEFMETLNNSSATDLKDIVRNAEETGYNTEKIKKFPSLMEKIGVQNSYVLNDLSLIKLVYGFTRGAPEDDSKILNRFASDKSTDQGKIPIYMNNSDTEAILLEFDRWKILKWLQGNGLVKDIPNRDDEAGLKAWFLSNIDLEKISPFRDIDEKEKITKAVYKLLHTISHSLILTGSVECGLDKNSLAELILPSMPAIIIYSSNVQGTPIGGMFTLFENNISPWIEKTLDKTNRCIYDPVCMDHKSACHACTYLSEISCVHFNYDLGREVLIGKEDIHKKTVGFWSKEFHKTINP